MKTFYWNLTIAFYILCYSYSGTAQVTFINQYDFGGDDAATAIKCTSDGGYVITGWKNNSLLLVKLDAIGDTIWSKSLYMFNGVAGTDIVVANNGDYVVTGSLTDLSYNTDLFLVRFNSNGDTLWTRKFGGPRFEAGMGLCATSDGGFIATGQTKSVCDSSEVYIVKTDSIGNLLWEKTYCNINLGWGNAIIPTLDNNFAIAAYNSSVQNWLLKIDHNGDTLWTKKYGFGGIGGHDILQNADGSYILTGSGILKTDANGNLIWIKPNTYGSLGLTGSLNTGYIGVRYSNDFFGDQYIYMLKVDNNGDSIWSRSYCFGQSAWGYDIETTQDGGCIICGRIDPNHDGSMDVVIIKTDENGLVVGLDEFDQPNETKVEVMPNPFTDYTYMKISGIIPTTSSLSLYNIFGTKILDMKPLVSNNIMIYRNNLAAGIYFYELCLSGINMLKGKLIIN